MRIKLKTLLALMALPAFLASCDFYDEGTITQNRARVIEEKFVQEVSLEDVDKNFLTGLSQRYYKHGDGPVELTLTYDPHSSTNTAMSAKQEANRITSTLNKMGVSEFNTALMPVKGSGDDSAVIFSFLSYSATGPADCDHEVPGIDSTDISYNREYKMGCSLESTIAKQIARPRDLLGRSQAPGATTDGRRGANIGELYRSGIPNEALEGGESASGQ